MLTSEGSYPKTTVAGLETNTFWDGLFQAATWVAVAIGLYILWQRTTDRRRAISGRAFIGWMLVGWGLFNIVEGIVDLHILTIHHVREGSNQTTWDLAFLGFGALLLIGGWALAHSERAGSPTAPNPLVAQVEPDTPSPQSVGARSPGGKWRRFAPSAPQLLVLVAPSPRQITRRTSSETMSM